MADPQALEAARAHEPARLAMMLAASTLHRRVGFLIDGRVRAETTVDRMCRYRLEQIAVEGTNG